MAKKRKYRRHSLEFKQRIVEERLAGRTSLKKVRKTYGINSKDVIKWTRRFLAGEPLEMKRGRHPKATKGAILSASCETELKAENERLKVELAFKTELLKQYEAQESLKKKNSSGSSSF